LVESVSFIEGLKPRAVVTLPLRKTFNRGCFENKELEATLSVLVPGSLQMDVVVSVVP
jgi:hypothetical protein